ncbi:MAG: hypothetical protein ABSB91_00265 [Sedimentisphaerales bacterium]
MKIYTKLFLVFLIILCLFKTQPLFSIANPAGPSGSRWGSIRGDINDQNDLKTTLNAKLSGVPDACASLWNGKTTIADACQTLWNSKTAIADACQILWNNKISGVPDACASLWNGKTTIADACQTLWNGKKDVNLYDGDEHLLATVYDVNMTAGAAATTLYTAPGDANFIPTRVLIYNVNNSLAGGSSYTFTGLPAGQNLISMTTPYTLYRILTLLPGGSMVTTVVAAGNPFTITITTGSTATALATIKVYGVLIR